MERDFDIVIIGAGIAGVGLAAALGPGPKVAILEQEPRHGYHSCRMVRPMKRPAAE